MKSVLYLLIFCFIVSCVTHKGFVTVVYNRIDSNEKNIKYFLTIPSGYKTSFLKGGHNEFENRYTYWDSATIYVSDFENGSLNFNNIKMLGDSVVNKRFRSELLDAALSKQLGEQYKPETIILQGRSNNGLFWKDIANGSLSIGYINVTENKKETFDRILASMKIR